jgi:DNA-binding NarL/FixJ family response regulator
MNNLKNLTKVIIYLAILIFFLYDLIADFFSDEFGVHFYLEIIFTVLMFYLLLQQILDISKTTKQLNDAKSKINNLQGEMINYINTSFENWGLTNAENEIAWLIIKGFAFKEIAKIRKVGEKTISLQASSIYKKSKTNNRHELMSLFLEEFIA